NERICAADDDGGGREARGLVARRRVERTGVPGVRPRASRLVEERPQVGPARAAAGARGAVEADRPDVLGAPADRAADLAVAAPAVGGLEVAEAFRRGEAVEVGRREARRGRGHGPAIVAEGADAPGADALVFGRRGIESKGRSKKTLPGLRIPFGSKASFTAFI